MSRKPKRKRKHRSRWTGTRAPTYAPPGTLTHDPAAPQPAMRIIAYGPDSFIDQPIDNPRRIAEVLHKQPVTWVNVDGLGDLQTIEAIGAVFDAHRLAIEDVVHVRQRAKVDEFREHLYIVARMIDRNGHGRLGTEQLSLFLGRDYVLTIQERPGDCLDAIRNRAREKLGRLREKGPDYLAYSILDAVVDEYFPVLEELGDRLEELEEQSIARPGPSIAGRIHEIKRDLLVLRRALWPLREALGTLYRGESPFVTEPTRLYLRDCYDHVVQALDLVEVYRELCSGLTDLVMTSATHRLNEIIKVLTIISTIFIPLTFIAGVYGMNFDYMPELRSRWGYPAVMILMAVIACGMLLYFLRKGWLGSEQAATIEHDESGVGPPH